MANFSCASTKQTSHWRFRVILTAAAFALAGCNADQAGNPSSHTAPGVVAGPDFRGYNAYDPTKYGQTIHRQNIVAFLRAREAADPNAIISADVTILPTIRRSQACSAI
jgi:hypothetical protein